MAWIFAGRGTAPCVLLTDPHPIENRLRPRPILDDEQGKYQPANVAGRDYDPSSPDPWLTVPLPWYHEAIRWKSSAFAPAAICLGIILFWGWRKKWLQVVAALMLLFCLPPLVGCVLWMNAPLQPEQHFDPAGWKWVWSYCLAPPIGWALFRSPLTWMLILPAVGWLLLRLKRRVASFSIPG